MNPNAASDNNAFDLVKRSTRHPPLYEQLDALFDEVGSRIQATNLRDQADGASVERMSRTGPEPDANEFQWPLVRKNILADRASLQVKGA